MVHDKEAARRLYQPSLDSISGGFRQMGESLKETCSDLADSMTVEQVDNVLTALRVADSSVRRLRLRLVADEEAGE